MKKIIASILFYALSGVGISLTLKADIGVSSFNSLNVAVSSISDIKVGTVTFLFNSLFLLAYILLAKKKEPLKYALMFVSILCLGNIINFFSYSVFGGLQLDNYFLKLLVFVLGTVIAGSATGMVISLNILPFPIESVCIRLSEMSGAPFSRFRYGVDIISVSISLAISLFYHLPIFVREGTIISLFLLSGVISFTKKAYEMNFTKQEA